MHRYILRYTLCLIGIHYWIINKWSRYRGRKKIEEGYERRCEWCDKHQTLQRPKKYHPLKYIWANVKKEE